MKLTRIEVNGVVHTPLPWAVYGPNPDPDMTMHAPAFLVMCADVDSSTIEVDGKRCVPVAGFFHELHDARLFHAAPDLLAACKEAEMLAAHGMGAINTSNDPDCKANADRNIAECIRIQGLIRAAITKAEGGAG